MKKKEFNPQDFLTRAEKATQMKIPNTDLTRIIVKPNNEALGFRFDCYEESLLKDRVNKNDFNDTVRQCNKICENVWRRKKMEEDEDYNKGLKRTLYIAIIFSIVSFIFLIILIYFDGHEALLFISVVFIIIAGLLTTCVVITSMFSQPQFIELEPTIQHELKRYLRKINQNTYEAQGLRWVMQESFYWLEVYVNQNMPAMKKVN